MARTRGGGQRLLRRRNSQQKQQQAAWRRYGAGLERRLQRGSKGGVGQASRSAGMWRREERQCGGGGRNDTNDTFLVVVGVVGGVALKRWE